MKQELIIGVAGYAIALAFFLLLTRWLVHAFGKMGTKAKSVDSASRWNANQKPTVGGIIFIAGLLTGAIYSIFRFPQHEKYLLLLSCGIAAFLLGLWDDLRRISAGKKLIGQIFIAGFWVAADWMMRAESADSVTLFNAALAFFIIVGLMNSVNMLDNMDAISSISALPALVWSLVVLSGDGAFAGFFLAALIAFLLFNWSPSKIFMGDSGSLLLGFVLAWIVLNVHPVALTGRPVIASVLLLFVLCLGYLVDTSVVVINRLRHGISPATGGRDHTTHHLVYSGFSERKVALTFIVIGITQVFLMFRVLKIEDDRELIVTGALVAAYFFLLFTLMYIISNRNLRSGKLTYRK